MFNTKQYRAKANEYSELSKGSTDPSQIREYQDSSDSVNSLANNEEWLANNFDKILHKSSYETQSSRVTLAAEREVTPAGEEEHVLRCLGASVIMQWNSIPTKLQRSSLTPPDRRVNCRRRPSCADRSLGFCTSTKTSIRKHNTKRFA